MFYMTIYQLMQGKKRLFILKYTVERFIFINSNECFGISFALAYIIVQDFTTAVIKSAAQQWTW